MEEITVQLRTHIQAFRNSSTYSELCNIIADQVLKQAQEIRKARLQNELQRINKRIKECYKTLPTDGEAEQLNALYVGQRNIMRKITSHSVKVHTLAIGDMNVVKDAIEKHLSVNTLDENILRLFISRIEIGHTEKDSAGPFKRIKLYYRF